MANSGTTIVVEHAEQLADLWATGKSQALVKLGNFFNGMAGGAIRGGQLVVKPNGAAPVRAAAVVTISSGSGALTIDINNQSAIGSETWATSDTVTATALVADIVGSSNAKVQYQVSASNFSGTVTCASVSAGDKVYIRDTTSDQIWEFTAVNGGTVKANQFDMSGSDTADGASLAAQILATPVLNNLVYPSAASGVVTLFQRTGTSNTIKLTSSNGTRLAVAAVAAGAKICISAIEPGLVGNCFTVLCAGTGITPSSTTNFGDGAGGGVAANTYTL